MKDIVILNINKIVGRSYNMKGHTRGYLQQPSDYVQGT